VAVEVAFRVRPPDALLLRLFEPESLRLRERAPPK
jgi:hypothetical protein